MNIKEAKNEVMKAVKIYLEKDEHGEYRVPVVRQRPLFLQGAPGLGKTAIMEQVASELDIALVSYSMTHHTRQSAIGLPFGRYWPVKPEAMVLDAEKICTSCFRVWKTEAAKKYFAIDGLAAVAGEWKWKMLAGWRRKGMCRRPGSVGLWAASRPRRKQRCLLLENVHLVFSRLENSRLLFLLAG